MRLRTEVQLLLCLALAGCAQQPVKQSCEPLPKVNTSAKTADYVAYIRKVAQMYAECANLKG